MARWNACLKCIGQAIASKGLKALVNCVPFGELLWEIAADAINRIKAEEPEESKRREDLEALAQAPAGQVQAAATDIAIQVAAGQPPAVQQALSIYLSQIPAFTRSSLSRPADPSGRSVPATLSMSQPEDLLRFLPTRPPRFKPGDRPASLGDWELVELLGVGGFGEVWKARHPVLHGTVAAVKFCLDPAAQDRLVRHESGIINEIMKQGHHPGIVPLLDAQLDADPPWLKFEYVEGGDLTGLAPSLKGPQATQVVQELAEIVGHFHRLHPAIVHRDLKPANVLAQRLPNGTLRLRVADFGIGGLAARHALNQSHIGTSRGDYLATVARGAYTPLYASPQQKRGNDPDVRDDVYALGVMWYQFLIGDLGSERPGGKWRKRVADLGLSADALDLLEGCCDDDANERPVDAADLAEKLKALLQAVTEVSIPPDPPPAVSEIPVTPPQPGLNTRPGEQLVDKVITNSLGMKLVRVPRGTFRMSGGGKGGNKVEVPHDFYVGVYPVTQGEWQDVMGSNPSWFSPNGGGAEKVRSIGATDLRWFPVEQVSWDDAQEFIRRLNERENRNEWLYRLPTEPEWEYSCRGGACSKKDCSYHFYFDQPTNDLATNQANFGGTLGRTSKVGSYKPNRLGIYDMHGNVWEWCDNQTGSWHMYRGGSWGSRAENCRAAYYGSDMPSPYRPSHRNRDLGLRLALVPSGT